MITIRTLPTFDHWFTAIKDKKTSLRLVRRLERVQLSQFGDVKAVGEGVFELREHFGSGWRMYYVQGVQKSSSCWVVATIRPSRRYCQGTTLGGYFRGLMGEKISVSSLPVFDIVNLLDGDEAISEYLSQVLEDGDSDELIRALGYIAKAKGMAMIAQKSGLSRESLYKALSPGSEPRFDTVLKVIKALGIKLHAEPV
ncbi:MAG: putative addiction module antidote protein [Methylovulum sp.]|nr:putative addiction module antidote protein [Methylovulum sp.]